MQGPPECRGHRSAGATGVQGPPALGVGLAGGAQGPGCMKRGRVYCGGQLWVHGAAGAAARRTLPAEALRLAVREGKGEVVSWMCQMQ